MAEELLKIAKPDLLKDWDFERNAAFSLDTIRINAPQKVSWKCRADKRHRWEARVRNRAIDGNGCPFCSGRKTLREDSFGTLYPEIARELHHVKNPGFDPYSVSPGSNKLVYWVCSNGHEWRSVISRRVRDKSGCRKCAYVKGRPKLDTSPLALEFHPNMNGTKTVQALTLGSRERVWWRCRTNPSHEWRESIHYRALTGNKCPKCYPRTHGQLQTLDRFSDALCREWHPTRNGSLSPKSVTAGSSLKVWWQCVRNSAHPAWLSVVRNRTINKQGCPRCAPRAFDNKRTIAVMNPGLVAEWHPSKNGPLTPFNVTVGSSRNVWWRCANNSTHVWQRIVNVRTKGTSPCPFCSGQSVTPALSLRGSFPGIASEWHPTKNGDLTPDLVKAKSAKKVYWQCASNPAHEWLAQIKNRTINGSGCPWCARENNILQIQNDLNKAAFNTTEVYRTFLFSIRRLESLSKEPPAKAPLRILFFQMLYAQAITSLEAYLSDAFLKLVVGNAPFKKRLVGEATGFKEKKYTLAEILEFDPTSDDAIASALCEISWHNIPRVKTLYSVVCGIEITGDIYPLIKAVANRHDIVHRNGRSIKGKVVAVGEKEVLALFSTIRNFAHEYEHAISLVEKRSGGLKAEVVR